MKNPTMPAVEHALPATTRPPRKTWPVVLHVCALGLLLAGPYALDPFYVSLAIPFMAYAIVLLGFNLLFGYGGLLSFGAGLFVAIGAYCCAALTRLGGGVAFEGMLSVAILTAIAIAVPLAVVTCRFTGIFFGMLTLSFGMLFHSLLMKFYIITGGETGLLVAQPTLLGMKFAQMDRMQFLTGPFYFYCTVLLTVAYLAMRKIVDSPYGLHLMASRDNDVKATYLGVRVQRVRAVAFVIAAVYGSVGGAILGVNTGLADPELAYWTHSGHIVFMAVLGGYQEFVGPIVGALVFTLLQDQLQSWTQYWRLWMGVVLAVIVVAAPGGLAGTARKLFDRSSKS